MTRPTQDYILSLLVDNELGTLARIVGVFAARGYNIQSITAAEIADQKKPSRILIATEGTPAVIEQIKAQLSRIVTVHSIDNLSRHEGSVERELLLIKIKPKCRKTLDALLERFEYRIIEQGSDWITYELVSSQLTVNAFLDAAQNTEAAEDVDFIRTGIIALRKH